MDAARLGWDRDRMSAAPASYVNAPMGAAIRKADTGQRLCSALQGEILQYADAIRKLLPSGSCSRAQVRPSLYLLSYRRQQAL
jgi:hypothetical protein